MPPTAILVKPFCPLSHSSHLHQHIVKPMGNHINCQPYLTPDDFVVETPQKKSVGTQAPRGWSTDSSVQGDRGEARIFSLPANPSASSTSKQHPRCGEEREREPCRQFLLCDKRQTGVQEEPACSPSSYPMGRTCAPRAVSDTLLFNNCAVVQTHEVEGTLLGKEPAYPCSSPSSDLREGKSDSCGNEMVHGLEQLSRVDAFRHGEASNLSASQNRMDYEVASNVTDPDKHVDTAPSSQVPHVDSYQSDMNLDADSAEPDYMNEHSLVNHSTIEEPKAPLHLRSLPPSCATNSIELVPRPLAQGTSSSMAVTRAHHEGDWTGWVQGIQGMLDSAHGHTTPKMPFRNSCGGRSEPQHNFLEYSAIDAKLKAREWQWQLKMETKTLEREIKKIQVDETKLKKKIATEAKKGNTEHIQQLARSIVRSRQAVARLEKAKASMNDITLQLTTAIASISMKSAMRVSLDAMRDMNGSGHAREIETTMEQMRREMAYSSEVDNCVEEAFHEEEAEEEAAIEVQRVLEELELDQLGLLASSGASSHIEPLSLAGSSAAQPATSALHGTYARQGGS